MVSRPLLLDLFCGAGGCAVGYHRAGFDVIGVDHRPMPRYPFSSVQEDALAVLERLASGKTWRGYRARDFGVIHASPPCQRYSHAIFCRPVAARLHPDLVTPTLAALEAIGRPWIIENVPRAPLGRGFELCGLMFGLNVFRHRRFASSALVLAPSHPGHGRHKVGYHGFACVAGHGGGTTPRMRRQIRDGGSGGDKAAWSAAMGIDWMTRDELAQAIPPTYCEFIGRQLLAQIAP
jgi:DNA (cytosine-5)-methyltransferase 1